MDRQHGHRHVYSMDMEFFFFFICFGESEVHFRNILLCCPSQRSARSQVPSQVATHLEIGSQLWAGDTLDSNPGLQDNSLARYHWATTPPSGGVVTWNFACSTDTGKQNGHKHAVCTVTGSINLNMRHGYEIRHVACTCQCPSSRDMDMQHVQVHAAHPCWMSMLRDHVHHRCPCPYCMWVHVYAACPSPCWMTMSMLHVHVYAACPCLCCMSMSTLYVFVHTAFLSPQIRNFC